MKDAEKRKATIEKNATYQEHSGMLRITCRNGDPEYIFPDNIKSIITSDGKGTLITASGRWIESPLSADDLHIIIFNTPRK